MVKSMVKLVNGSQLGCGWLEGKCKLNITECIRCSSRRELVTGLSPDPKTFKRVEQYEQYDYMNSRLSLLSFLSFQTARSDQVNAIHIWWLSPKNRT